MESFFPGSIAIKGYPYTRHFRTLLAPFFLRVYERWTVKNIVYWSDAKDKEREIYY